MDRQSECPHFVCRLMQKSPVPVLDIDLNANIFSVPGALLSYLTCQFSTTHSYVEQEPIFSRNAAVSKSSFLKFLSPNDFVQG